MSRPYIIKEVDGFDGAIALELEQLHIETFWNDAPQINPEIGHWWLVYSNKEAIGFAGMQESTVYPGSGYFNRVGVLHKHRGQRLTIRLMMAIASRARRNGWKSIVSDNTTDNPASANNFMRLGYRMFWPKRPWGLPNSMYWHKQL